uniref:Hypothetical non-ribosomal peptide synthetase n=1 Tax=Actinomadura sp. SoC090715LN-10 TaxID=1898655 RepID=A0A1L7NQE3_9ACTN|nr:hypothetical non-ribosomal peptide synthetase [Actinomadura sp. SoC090715LN-10]
MLPEVVRMDHWPADATPAPSGKEVRSAHVVAHRVLDPELAARVRAVTRGDAVLLHTLVTAALAICFAGRSGERTIWLAVPPVRPSTSDAAEDDVAETVLGHLPVPVLVDPVGTGQELLPVVRGALLNAYGAQYCDEAWLTSQVGGPVSTDGLPLATWLVEHTGLHQPVQPGLDFDGVLRVEDGLTPTVSVTGAPRLFTAASLGRLADQVVDVLTVLVTEPGTRLAEIPRWRPADRESALAAARGASSPDPTPSVELILGQGDSQRPAVVAEDGTLSHEELAARSTAVARGMRTLLAGADADRPAIIGLLTGQCATTVVGACAALRAHIPYVVVPPDHAKDWALLRERGVTLAVVASPVAEQVPAEITVSTIEELERLGGEPAAEPLPDMAPSDAPAYLIFTSGSTGAAKAVVVTRHNLAASNAARQTVYGTEPPDFLLLSPLHFDSSVAGLYWTLSCGGTLHIAPPASLRDPALLAQRIGRHAISTTLGLPRMLEGIASAAADDELRSLRVVVGAGETFPAGLARLLRQRAPDVRVVNEYGPSEATVWATYHDVADTEVDVPIGRPVPGLRVHVLDGWGEPVPPGCTGQLAIGGPQVCAGYAGALDLTAERFVADRFGGDGDDRLFLTGDEGYVGPDGALRFVGRADDEVKIRGVRVQLADVAAAFRTQAEVDDAEALLDDGQLILFLAGPGELDGDAVVAAVRPTLTDHSVPARVIVVPEIPRLSNNKCDRERLLALARRAPSPSESLPDPTDALERRVLALFRTTIGVDGIGPDDDFFAAGGDSVKAALLTAQLSRELSTYLYVVALLDNPTPAMLAAFLRREYGQALTASGLDHDEPVEGAACLGPMATASTAVSEATPEAADRLRRLIAADHGGVPAPRAADRLPPPVFILGPPRSGTTLMRIILSGHPQLFAPPELELLQYGTLAQRRKALSGRYTFNREGLVRAVMSLRDCPAPEAEALLDQMADEGCTVRDTYRWLMEQAGDRRLVDKTTEYALDMAALTRAEQMFDQPRYIHLVRHPQACVASFLEARLDQTYLRVRHDFTPEQAAELVWRLAHEQAAVFLDGIDPERVLRVSFEDLVAEPESQARRICDFLDIPYNPQLLQVYDDRRARMTDGLRPGGRMLGDIKFHEHSTINAAAADRWHTNGARRPLHPSTMAVARELGYGPDGRIAESGLTSQQRFMWFLEFMRPGTAMYNIPVLLGGQGDVDESALRRAVRTVARRHHAFRSVVVAPDGEPMLRFVPDLTPAVTIEKVPTDQQRERAEHLAVQPFDVERDSLLRVHLLRDGDRFMLLLVVHHIVADAMSLGFIVGDLLEAYEHWRTGKPPRMPALPRQVADAGAEEASLDVTAVEELTQRVRGRLVGATWPLRLPEPTVPVGDGRSALVEVHSVIDASTTAAVREYAAARGCSLYRVLLVAFGWTLATLTGDRDLCVGTPVLRRGPFDERTVGLFVNTALVRLDLTGSVTFDDLVARAKVAVRDAIADAELPYEEVIAALADLVDEGDALLQAAFSVQRVDLPLDRSGSLRLHRLTLSPPDAKFDIAVSVADENGQLTVRAELAGSRFDEVAARRFVEDFVSTTHRLVGAPAARLEITG